MPGAKKVSLRDRNDGLRRGQRPDRAAAAESPAATRRGESRPYLTITPGGMATDSTEQVDPIDDLTANYITSIHTPSGWRKPHTWSFGNWLIVINRAYNLNVNTNEENPSRPCTMLSAFSSEFTVSGDPRGFAEVTLPLYQIASKGGFDPKSGLDGPTRVTGQNLSVRVEPYTAQLMEDWSCGLLVLSRDLAYSKTPAPKGPLSPLGVILLAPTLEDEVYARLGVRRGETLEPELAQRLAVELNDLRWSYATDSEQAMRAGMIAHQRQVNRNIERLLYRVSDEVANGLRIFGIPVSADNEVTEKDSVRAAVMYQKHMDKVADIAPADDTLLAQPGLVPHGTLMPSADPDRIDSALQSFFKMITTKRTPLDMSGASEAGEIDAEAAASAAESAEKKNEAQSRQNMLSTVYGPVHTYEDNPTPDESGQITVRSTQHQLVAYSKRAFQKPSFNFNDRELFSCLILMQSTRTLAGLRAYAPKMMSRYGPWRGSPLGMAHPETDLAWLFTADWSAAEAARLTHIQIGSGLKKLLDVGLAPWDQAKTLGEIYEIGRQMHEQNGTSGAMTNAFAADTGAYKVTLIPYAPTDERRQCTFVEPSPFEPNFRSHAPLQPSRSGACYYVLERTDVPAKPLLLREITADMIAACGHYGAPSLYLAGDEYTSFCQALGFTPGTPECFFDVVGGPWPDNKVPNPFRVEVADVVAMIRDRPESQSTAAPGPAS